MVKNKIFLKLSSSYFIALLLFAIIICIAFFFLFEKHSMHQQTESLQDVAIEIQEIISTDSDGYPMFIDKSSNPRLHKFYHDNTNAYELFSSQTKKRYMPFVNFVNEALNANIWLVDENLNFLIEDTNQSFSEDSTETIYSELYSENTSSVVYEAMTGSIAVSEGFNETLNQKTITIGVPIYTYGEISGAVIVYSTFETALSTTENSILILLLCAFIALCLSLVIITILSYSFTRPLSKMKNVAVKLTQDDYSEQCNITQNDEIGELAKIIDTLSIRLESNANQQLKMEAFRKEYVANVSHELKTPVTVIKTSLEALCDNIITEPSMVSDCHKNMLIESDYLERLIGDLLELSRLQNANFPLESNYLSISDLLNDAVRSITPLAKKKEIILNKKINGNLTIKGDYGRLRQMIVIVLDNAIKFSNENSSINIIFANDTITIQDYGIGIPSSDLPFIFDRFYKSERIYNTLGSGLGLPIAKEIAERHSIELTVNTPGTCSTEFVFKLPN